MYREKYYSLKRGFIPKLLQSIIDKRGDIEYINTYGNDENDTFFMKIGQITQILSQLPSFLQSFLSHLTCEFYENYIELNENNPNNNDNNDHNDKNINFRFNQQIASSIQELAKRENIIIRNEKDELVHQLITIRIALKYFNVASNQQLNTDQIINHYMMIILKYLIEHYGIYQIIYVLFQFKFVKLLYHLCIKLILYYQ